MGNDDTGRLRDVKASSFDVFGTLVDWRTSLVDDFERWSERRGIRTDWVKLVEAWRIAYAPALDKVRNDPPLDFRKLNSLHREALEILIAQLGIPGLDEDDLEYLVKGWHCLNPWPDTVPRTQAPKNSVHYRSAVERQRLASHRVSQARGPVLGSCAVRRALRSLQAGSRSAPRHRRDARSSTEPGDDGGFSQLRSGGGEEARPQNAIRAAADQVRARPDAPPRGRRKLGCQRSKSREDSSPARRLDAHRKSESGARASDFVCACVDVRDRKGE